MPKPRRIQPRHRPQARSGQRRPIPAHERDRQKIFKYSGVRCPNEYLAIIAAEYESLAEDLTNGRIVWYHWPFPLLPLLARLAKTAHQYSDPARIALDAIDLAKEALGHAIEERRRNSHPCGAIALQGITDKDLRRASMWVMKIHDRAAVQSGQQLDDHEQNEEEFESATATPVPEEDIRSSVQSEAPERSLVVQIAQNESDDDDAEAYAIRLLKKVGRDLACSQDVLEAAEAAVRSAALAIPVPRSESPAELELQKKGVQEAEAQGRPGSEHSSLDEVSSATSQPQHEEFDTVQPAEDEPEPPAAHHDNRKAATGAEIKPACSENDERFASVQAQNKSTNIRSDASEAVNSRSPKLESRHPANY